MPKSPADASREMAALAALDLRAAEALADRGDELASVVLFHAQQAAEKWLKAFLIARAEQAPRTHILGPLLDGCIDTSPALEALRADAEFLTPFAVAPRYVLRPVGDPALVPRALDAARRFRDASYPVATQTVFDSV